MHCKHCVYIFTLSKKIIRRIKKKLQTSSGLETAHCYKKFKTNFNFFMLIKIEF